MPKQEGIHANHRAGLKKRFVDEGINGFEDHNVLEMLLFYSVPRCDTNEIAHELLREFGSLSAVFDADINALTRVPGVGRESAVLIKFIPALFQRYQGDIVKKETCITGASQAVEYLKPFVIGKEYETMLAIMLDGRANVKRVCVLGEGSKDGVQLNYNKLLREILVSGATGIVLAHTHPQGFAVPSEEDVIVTDYLLRALQEQHISLCDNIILSGEDYYAFSENSNTCILPSRFAFGKDIGKRK